MLDDLEVLKSATNRHQNGVLQYGNQPSRVTNFVDSGSPLGDYAKIPAQWARLVR